MPLKPLEILCFAKHSFIKEKHTDVDIGKVIWVSEGNRKESLEKLAKLNDPLYLGFREVLESGLSSWSEARQARMATAESP